MNLVTQVQTLDALAASLSKATSVRDKVKLADRIYETLGECERMVEHFIVSELGSSNGKGSHSQKAAKSEGMTPFRAITAGVEARQFRGKTLAEVGRLLLKERGTMHGSEIETLAKAGGFAGKAVKFQSYLAVAFKRDGGFENLGKNRWRLTDAPA